jgi:hypothetical protein
MELLIGLGVTLLVAAACYGARLYFRKRQGGE